MPLMTWTAEADAELRRLWGEGQSAGRIAAVMAVSKNSIIGRAHRLGLPGRYSPIRRPAATTIPRRVAAPAAIPAAAARGQPQRPETPAVTRPAPEAGATPAASPAAAGGSPAPYPRPAALRPAAWWRTTPIHYPADLGCRWIQGEPRGAETLFCDAARVSHRPYCPAHCARAYQLWRGPDATAAPGEASLHAAPGRSSGVLDVSSQTAPAGQGAASPAALSGRDAA